MKHLIVLTVALFAGFANARSIMLPSVKLDQVSQKIESVAVYPNGRLVVTNREGGFEDIQLAPSVKARLSGVVESLASAELQTVRHDIVCMMMPNPFTARELYVTSNQGLRLTLSAGGCAAREVTSPKEEYLANMAQELREMLTLLGQQAAND